MKKLVYALLLVGALVLLVAGGSLWYLRSAEADYGRDASVAGLSAAVEIWRDSLGVPHIWAANESDLFRAMGYVHAQDRLWQMELFRRVADGRMAEILGSELIETDRFLRTLGMGRAAEANQSVLDSDSRALLQAYADGVNAWMTGHPGALPPEFVALRFKPEPWTVRNSLAISKIMAWDLADWEQGLDLQHAVDQVGPELAEELAPQYPEWGVHILGTDATWKGKVSQRTRPAPTPQRLRASTTYRPRIPDSAIRLLESVSIARASNSWVIGGSRTRSGKPILANDMHLALRAPSLWYLAALHGGGVNATGMTIPGTPVVIAGHTDGVAWGYTNAMTDDTDFFVEEVSPQDSMQYRTPEGWRRFQVREETIQVKGQAPVVHRVRATRHGPVLSDVEERSGSRVLAMRWTAHDVSNEFRALIGMNRARNAAEFLHALRDFTNPHQNVVFADTEGEFGYWMAGRIPVRRSGDGLLPAPGWTGEYDWERYLEWDEHPHVLNPADGFVVTANNRQVGADYPFHIGQGWAEPFRAMRIREMIESGRDFTADDVAAQQMDVRDAFALRYLPHAVRAAEAAGVTSAVADLRAWNGEAREDSRAAALFYTWYDVLRRRVGEDEYRGERMYFPRAVLNRVLDQGGGRWVDDIRTAETETLAGLSADAMGEAVQTVGTRTWGDLHVTEIRHALGAARILDRTLALNIGPFPNGGSPYTVNVAGYGGTRPPFRNTGGASQRHVVDMADIDGSGGFIIPTGQSGLPFSDHYRDQTPMWRQGRLWRIPLERTAAEARAVHRQVLRPNGGA
jgi:penicillin amidase